MARAVSTFALRDPVNGQDGTVIRMITVREPTVADFIELGPLVVGPNTKHQVCLVDVPGRLTLYLRRCVLGLASADVDALLASMSLPDAVRLKRLLNSLVCQASRDDVTGAADAVALDHRLMSLDDVDDLGLSQLTKYCARLTAHLERQRARQRK